MKVTSITLFLLMLWQAGLCQSVSIKQFTVQEGMPSTEVYNIYQDRQGFIWFCTDNGVVKYDGYSFKVYQLNDGLADQVIFGFYEDKEGRLWFISYSGLLSYYQNGKIYKYAFNKMLKEKVNSSILLNILFDKRGLTFSTYTWAGGTIDPEGRFTAFDLKSGSMYLKQIDSSFVFGALGAPGTATHINIDGKEFGIQRSSPEVNFNICTAEWKGLRIFSTGHDVFSYDGKEFKRVFSGKGRIISLSPDKSDRLWVGYAELGAEYFENDFTNPKSYSVMDNKSITRVFQDEEGGLWFTSLEKGVFYVPNISITINQHKTDSRISAVLNTRNYILQGDYEGTLIGHNKKTNQTVQIKKRRDILKMVEMSTGRIWVATSGTTYIMDESLNPINQINEVSFHDFAEGKDGSVWSLANSVHNNDADGGFQKAYKKISGTSRTFLLEENRFIFIDKTGGLFTSNDSIDQFTTYESFAHLKISKILKLKESLYLISTIGNGFYFADANFKRIKEFSTGTNLIADNIYAALAVDTSLWFGTEKGIIVTSMNSLSKPIPQYSLLTKNSGLPSDKINFLVYVPETKKVWCFTDEGYSILPSNISQFSNNDPKFYLKDLEVNGSEIKTSNHLKLKYNENNIHINFGFIDFNHQDIRLRYRLAQNLDWNYSTNRFIYLYSLSDGEYGIDLEYSIDNSNWRKAPLDLLIDISPVWWKSVLFQIAAILIVGMIAGVFFRYRIKQFRERNKFMEVINSHQNELIKSEIDASERERNRIAKELHDSVGTDLSALKLIVSQLPQDSNQQTIEEQLQHSIQEIKNIVYNLTPPGIQRYGLSIVLKSHIDRLSTSGVKIEFNSFGNDSSSHELSITVFRIIQELLSNSLKHSSAKKITIHINTFHDLISIVYEDNGIGFSYDAVKPGLGLQNIESRIKSINGRMKFESGDFGISYTIDIPLKQALV